MVLGSLADQVTYPHKVEKADRTPEMEQQLQELLNTVGIGYLVKRWAGDSESVTVEELGWDHVTRWEVPPPHPRLILIVPPTLRCVCVDSFSPN
jgi:ABC-type uncharacterized transport system fused permease/ATPase subunit